MLFFNVRNTQGHGDIGIYRRYTKERSIHTGNISNRGNMQQDTSLQVFEFGGTAGSSMNPAGRPSHGKLSPQFVGQPPQVTQSS